MSRKSVLVILLTLLFASMLTSASNFRAHAYFRPVEEERLSNDESTSKLNFTYYFSKPRIENARYFNKSFPYVSVTMEGLPQHEETGLPVLPFKTTRILLPFATRLEQIDVICGRKIPLLGSYLVEYGEEPVPLTINEPANAPATNFCNETVYSSSEPFPNRVYSDVSVQSKMGYKILVMNLHPVEYTPKTGKLFYYENISVEVEVGSEKGGETSVFSGYLQRHEIMKGFVDNPKAAETYPTSEQTPTYQYVIITNEELNSTPSPYNFQALKNDKISRNISTTIVTVEWIYANYYGEDNQTKIRNFIIDAYSSWGTMYILLGGDGDGGDSGGESGDTIIPHRGFYGKVGWWPFETEDYDIPADMYYSCLDGTFDYDGDGIYGEPNDGPAGGEVDLFAEVYVGRACVDSQVEVENFVRKTLSYQSIIPTSEHLRKVWMVGEYLGFGGPAEWGGNSKDEIKEGSSTHGYTTIGFENSIYSDRLDVNMLYDRDYPSHDWPKSDIIHVINDNVNLINHLGHANVGYVMKMGNSDVDTLTNEELYFVGYSQGCYSGSFDDRTTTPGIYTSYDCISEHFTTEANGAVAFVANSRYGWGKKYSTDGPSQHYDREFWDAILGEDIFNIGIANQDSKEDNAGRVSSAVDRWCYYQINLFGDPELKVKFPGVYEHDLAVALEAPVCVEPNNSSLVEATVYNLGLNNELDVQLSIIINGTTVSNGTIPELVKGESYTLDYLWTPTVEGVYNVTAFASPVPGEEVTENNREMASVQVRVMPDILIVDDNDGNAWINGTSSSQFASALTTLDYDYMLWNESSTGNPPLDFLTQFKAIIWTCGDYWGVAVDPVDATILELYLDQGGSLLLEGEDIAYDHRADSFMLNVAHATFQIDTTGAPGLTLTDSDHPVVNELPSNFTWATFPPFDDGVTPTNTGMEVVEYTGTAWTAVTVFEGTQSKVVYYAFPLYCLDEPEQETLALNSVSWLLEPPRTFGWVQDRIVCGESSSSSERRPAMATDSNGHLYVAYEHYNPDTAFYEIYVSKSTDNGDTWSTIGRAHENHNLRYPSIAIDVGDNNNIFVAYEREWTSTDHDIFVLRYVDDSWDVTLVANTIGNDDRYPSITSEHQYGSADRQYISYEHAYSYDDRDLWFAKSVDDGATWPLRKLHGSWPDYNVHSQTSITTTRGSDGNDYIYIAYKWGADYNTAYDIVVDKSDDYGNTWTQQWVCDEFSRDKNWPSITATHGGGTVVIAWHVYSDSTYLNDVQYAHSTNNGDSWNVDWLAWETYVNEETPILTVDGQDSTSTSVCGCIHVAYWRDDEIYHRETFFNSPWLWTPTEVVTDTTAYVSAVYTKPAITTYRSAGGRYFPAVAWTDSRNSSYGIYYSTRGPMHTIDSNPQERTVEVDGESHIAPVSFYWIEGSTHTINVSSPQYVSSDVRYVFENWSDGGVQSHIITAGVSDQKITAHFTVQYYLSVTTNPSELTPQPIITPIGPWYANSTSVNCTAQSVTGCTFDQWTVDEINQGQGVNPITIMMNEPHKATAYYLYEHDLSVALDVPIFLELGDSSLLNATVYNHGFSNETNVELQLLSNGSIVDSVSIPELLTGSSYTLSYLWTPTIEGIYNITAYVSPVTGETVTANNMKSVIVFVQVLPPILIVNDNDGGYWINGTSLPEFESALTAADYDYWVWNESSMGNPSLDFLVNFKLVIWTCGDYSNEAVDPVDTATLESYIAQDGNILLEGEDIGYNHVADSFMINVAHAIYQVDKTEAPGLTVTNPTHLVTQGLPSNFTWLTNPPHDDGVNPTNGGFEVIRYTNSSWTAVTLFDGTETSNGSIAYYAFPLYCLAQPVRDMLIINCVNWLLVRDIAVGEVTLLKTVVGQRYSVFINATVENQGDLTENFNVTAYTDLNTTIIGDEITIGIKNVTLTSGNSTTVTFTWNTTDVPYGNYTASAVADTIPNETNTTDNTYVDGWVIVTIAGDVDGDYDVDSDDIYLFAGAYGTSPPSIPNCDLDGDDDVDADDLYIFAGNYGKTA